MAERVGFEPTIPVKVCPLSRRIVSTTHAPLRVGRLSSCRVLRTTNALTTPAGSRPAQLTTILKERLQHFRAAPGEHSAENLNLVIQLRMIQNLHHRMHCPSLRVIRAIHQASYSCMNQRT